MKHTKESAQALTNLRGNPEFNHVLKWLKENREKARDVCCTADGPTLFRAQGEANALDAFIKSFEKAPATTEKFKQGG